MNFIPCSGPGAFDMKLALKQARGLVALAGKPIFVAVVDGRFCTTHDNPAPAVSVRINKPHGAVFANSDDNLPETLTVKD